MQTTRRPLPRIPPPHLTPVRSADIRSYRPLPTPPPRSTDSSCASSIGSAYIQTPPSPHVTRDSSSSLSSITSFASSSSELLSKPRPGLRISVAPPTLGERNSFDPLTVRTPALCDPCSRRFSRVSATSSDGSPLVFEFPAVVNGPDVFELEKDEPVSVPRIPRPKNDVFDRTVTPRPPRSQPTTMRTSRIGIDHPVTAVRVVTDMIGSFEIEGLNPRTAGSISLTNGRESSGSNGRNWKSFSNIVKVATKSQLFHRKPDLPSR